MAYDGTIRFDTSLDASGLEKGANSLGNIVKGLGIFEVLKNTVSMITQQVGAAMNRIDTMDQFGRVMGTITGSTEKANAALSATTDIVKGTAFGLDTAAKGVQAFVSSGMTIQKATDTMGAWGDAVAFYTKGTNAELGTVSAALQKMQTKGTVTMEHMQMLLEAGIPAIEIYASAVGKSTDEVAQEMSKGQLKTSDFITAMNSAFQTGTSRFPAIAGAAKEAGASWSGSMDNMRAAITRGVGACLTEFDKMFNVKENMVAFGKTIESALKLVSQNLTFLIPTITAASAAIFIFRNRVAISDVLSGVGNAFRNATNAIRAMSIDAVSATAATTGLSVAQKLLTVVMSAGNIILAAVRTVMLVMTGATWAQAAATAGLTGATGALSVAWGALNALFAASPLGWILLAIVGVVAAIAGLVNAVKNANKEYYAEKDALKALKEEHDGYADALQKSKDAAQQEAQEKVAQAQHNRDVLDSLAALTDENGNYTGSAEEAKLKVAELNKNIDGLGLAYDETTGKLNMSKQQLTEYGKNLEAVARYEAAQQQYNSILSERNALQAKINALEEKKKVYNQMLQDGTISQGQYNSLMREANSLSAEYDNSMVSLEADVKAYEAAAQNAYNKEAEIAVKRQEIMNNQSNDVKQLAMQYGVSFDDILNEASKLDGGLEEWATNMAGKFTRSGMDIEMLAKKWGMTADEVQGYCDEWGMNYDEFNEHMKSTHTDAGLSLEQVAAKWGTTTEAIDEQMKMQEMSLEEYDRQMEENLKQFQDAVSEHKDNIINSFQEIPAKYEMSAQEMIDVLAKNKERYAEWKAAMVEISGQVSAETLAELEKLGPGALSAINEMKENGGAKLKEFDELIKSTMSESTDYALTELNDPALAAAAGKMPTDMGSAIQGNTALKDATTAMIGAVKTELQTQATTPDVSGIGQTMMTNIASGITTGSVNVVSGITNMGTQIQGALNTTKTQAVSTTQQMMSAINSAIVAQTGTIRSSITSIGTAITSALNTLKTQAVSIIQQMMTAINSAIVAQTGTIRSSITSVGTAITQALTTTKTQAVSIIQQMMSGINSAITTQVGTIRSSITSVGTAITNALTDTKTKAVNIAADMMTGIKDKITSGTAAIKTAIEGIGTNISTAFETAKTNAIKSVGDMMTGIGTAITNSGQTLYSNAATAAGKIVDGFNSKKGDCESAGANLAAGVGAGLDSKAGDLYAKADSIAATIAAKIAAAWEEKSPSKLAFKMARYFMQGLYNGFDAMEVKLFKEAEFVADGISERMTLDPSGYDTLFSRLNSAASANLLGGATLLPQLAGAAGVSGGNVTYVEFEQTINSPKYTSPSENSREAQDMLRRAKFQIP